MLNEKLCAYVEKYIIPQYRAYDGAHQPDHVYQVIENSLAIAKNYDVDLDMVYTVAAYHDIGLKYGRLDHEASSRRMIERDSNLRQFFSEEEITVIGQAAEDHRASLHHEPRSIYGKIVSDADRDIDLDRLLLRTIQYTLHYSTASTQEEIYQSVYQHLLEKYGCGGRIRLWLHDDFSVKQLERLQEQLTDEPFFKKQFEHVYANLSEIRDNHQLN